MTFASPDPAGDVAISLQQIADLTAAYCRGVDRADEALLRSLFHDDSTVTNGAFNGNGQQFAAEICQVVRAVFDQTFHSIVDQRIEIMGDSATGETCVVAVLTMSDPDRGPSEMLIGGRYLDRFERRDGVWKIAGRRFVCDWNRVDSTTAGQPGRRGPDDPVYALWN